MKKKTFWSTLLLMFAMLSLTVACGGDDADDSGNKQVTIDEDGKVSNGSNFVSIDDKNFYLDYVKYTVEEGHLVVSGYDSKGFNGIAKIVSSITYKGNFYEVLEIGEKAFFNCSSLTSITIPTSVTTIGDRAFWYCTGLTSITIPNNVTNISNCAFESCSGLTSITIPNSVTSIGDHVFSNCSSLTSITIPNNVTSIGNYVFFSCSSLTSITIPNSVTSIGKSAFDYCTSLTSITIPNSVTSIGDYAFDGCTGLTSITVESGNSKYDSRNNCNAIIETESNTLILGCKNTSIPNSVTSIGNHAFEGCSGLTSITIPNSVTSIGKSAFDYCTSLTSITIPNSVTSIGYNAFNGCSGLTSVTIPNSVISIDGNVFKGCTGLTSITVESGNSKYDSRNNCNAIIETESNTLILGCKNTSIPNSVTNISNCAFEGCSGLTSVIFPNSVTSIGFEAFQGCTGLTSIHCKWETPPFTDNNIFEDVPYNTATLYVPTGTLEKYKSRHPWNNFTNIVEE